MVVGWLPESRHTHLDLVKRKTKPFFFLFWDPIVVVEGGVWRGRGREVGWRSIVRLGKGNLGIFKIKGMQEVIPLRVKSCENPRL